MCFLVGQDQRGLLYYAPLQGETAAKCLAVDLRQTLSTAVYLQANGEILVRSEAVLHALIDIGSRWRWLACLALKIPRSWRDGVYSWVAVRRKKFFSKGACPLPKPKDKAQLLP